MAVFWFLTIPASTIFPAGKDEQEELKVYLPRRTNHTFAHRQRLRISPLPEVQANFYIDRKLPPTSTFYQNRLKHGLRKYFAAVFL